MHQTAARPNIILINCDDLGYGDLGCYGSERNDTPVLDRMACEGARFTDFYMPACVCSPSRAGMLTGCYPARIGLETGCEIPVLRPGEPIGLSSEEVTIAGMLSETGYATEIIGKWHCGDQPEFLPTRHGFDSWYGLPYSNDMGMTKRHPDFPPLPLMRDEEIVEEQPDQAGLTERYTEEAVRFIRANHHRPFFLYFAHMYVHAPLYAPDRFIEASRNGRFGAAVAHIDFVAAVLLEELARLGLDENTLVIFTSDNGGAPWNGSSNAPLRGQKATTWEGGIRVPCIARWPGVIEPGRTVGALSTAMDFLPTFAGLSGGSLPSDRMLDGFDLAPRLFSPDGSGEAPYDAFFYYREHELQAVRAGNWKLHLLTGELYDLEHDIGESEDCASSHPEIIESLEAKAGACRHDLGDSATGETGEHRRPCGRVADPKPLTTCRPDHPYMVALYD